MKSFKIREFEPMDAEHCFRIRTSAFIKLFYDEIGPDAVTTGINAYLPEKYIQMAATLPIFVAVSDQTQIGYIAPRALDLHVIEILFLYIRLDSLGKGIGTELVRYLEDWIRKQQTEIRQIVVDTAVPKFNQTFYEKIGYLEAGKSNCQYPDGSIKAVRLVKNLAYTALSFL
ncbi:MAG: GNAT family N-acetyltransferase [Deltaproteobacteria bacterium]|jgi:GNAT superfamily N-acetyltransferase|nr:GNAT family N-acetyltransferase [Deltaproteobacteria bacterium]MBT4643501.1 GNAT family N-acetyltransferase [Deltaproteobacteria bacterium]MBT6499933.1 GNAT family N-acetyltransferase [Deltaproteobacteria bacterium]MBT6612805.1 GNAT family N-acetyltransferase [Deltaproteobacteria bacterium]MBT7153392.1 GNAT family N-acetyltransferase [Deltaproteobacteria bacterium]